MQKTTKSRNQSVSIPKKKDINPKTKTKKNVSNANSQNIRSIIDRTLNNSQLAVTP